MTRTLVERSSRVVVTAILLGWLGYTLVSWFVAWDPADAGAYYDAADRLLRGEPLYPATDPEAHEVFRYAPWFAVAWIPLTVLPRDVALHAWSLLMLGCSLLAVWPLLRTPSWASIALASLTGQTLVETSMFGNAHALVVAILVWTVGRRSFPAWVGATSSVKLAPLAFSLVWIGRREWRPAAVAIGVAGLLFAPMLLFDLSAYPTNPGTGLLSIYAVSPVLWVIAAAGVAAVTVWLAAHRSRYAWVAAAVLMFVGPPRVVTSYLSFIIVGYLLAVRDDG